MHISVGFLFRLTVKEKIIGKLQRQKKYRRFPKKLPVNQFLHSDLCVKKLISKIVNFHTILQRERIWHWKFDEIKANGQFLSCLEAATRKCLPKQLFF